jgi:hypothetical protein
VTIVIREFEDFENSLIEDILHYKTILGDDVHILIIADKQPYPPLQLNLTVIDIRQHTAKNVHA